mmetsp:Transcript_77246/g.215886  ORF Transcript_77246/g.215886 Transcript_77246/m.215886 type:complete len:204 (+) Transcript_77246:474-1085(+)
MRTEQCLVGASRQPHRRGPTSAWLPPPAGAAVVRPAGGRLPVGLGVDGRDLVVVNRPLHGRLALHELYRLVCVQDCLAELAVPDDHVAPVSCGVPGDHGRLMLQVAEALPRFHVVRPRGLPDQAHVEALQGRFYALHLHVEELPHLHEVLHLGVVAAAQPEHDGQQLGERERVLVAEDEVRVVDQRDGVYPHVTQIPGAAVFV